jgi:DNA-binding NtrC family response regulator
MVVSESQDLRDRISRLFAADGPKVRWQKNAAGVVRDLKRDAFDIVVLTSQATRNGNSNNDNLVRNIIRTSPLTQILFLSEHDELENVVSTLEQGTYQYARQPVGDTELRVLIETALEARVASPERDIEAESDDRLGNMSGRSSLMKKVFAQLRRAAQTDVPVLILGETGTGKDLAAQTIHQLSSRSGRPFQAVNLGSLPTELVASELFGHEKGAFSGAIQQHKGIFERACDGTVFLDEIDCIDNKVRVSLLRLLEQKTFERLGGTDTVNTNARLIAASNADLEALVERGEFRKDLFYRIDVFRVTMPPLRQRPEDIPLLIQEFLDIYSSSLEIKVKRVSKEFTEILQSYDWPGNIRELKNVIQRAVLMSRDGHLTSDSLPPRFREVDSGPARVYFELGTSLDEIERTMVIRALEATNNNRKEAAELLGISRRVIYNKLKKHGLH